MKKAILLLFIIFAWTPIFAKNAVENIQAIEKWLTHADTCYWFALNEHGDLAMFADGLKFVDKAEELVNKLEESDKRNELQRNIISLREDILEQYDMAHDTLYGAFPLIRFYTNNDETFEHLDEPFRTAPVRAAEGLIETIVEQWYRMPQVDVVFNSVIYHNGDGNLITNAPINSIALQNEMGYVFNQNSKFFVHTDRELVGALNKGELEKFYADEVDLNISDKICEQFSIERFLKVTAIELDVFKEYWFYIVRAQLYENKEGIQEDRMFVYGYGIDSRAKFPIIIIAAILLLCLPLLYSYYFYNKENSTLGVLLAVALMSLLISLGSGLGLATLDFSPEDLVKQILWIALAASAIIFVVPLLVMLVFHIKIINPLLGQNLLGDTKSTFAYCFAIFCGVLISLEYALLIYLPITQALIILVFSFLAGIATIWGSVSIIKDKDKDNTTSKIKGYGFCIMLSSASGVLYALSQMPTRTRDPFVMIMLLGFLLVMIVLGTLIVLNASRKSVQQINTLKNVIIFAALLVFLSLGSVLMTANAQLLLATTSPLVILWAFWGKAIFTTSSTVASILNMEGSVSTSEASEYTLEEILSNPVGTINYRHPLVRNIVDRIADLSKGSPAPIAIIGEAGSGKTTLVRQAFSENALEQINICRVEVQKTDVPYQMVEQLGEKLGGVIQKQDRFNELCNRLAGLVPLPGIATMLIDELGSEEEAPAVSNEEIANRLYEVLCDNAPLCVWVDDGENMDPQSSEVLSMISTRIQEGDRIALVTCFACDLETRKAWDEWVSASAFESLDVNFSQNELKLFLGRVSLNGETCEVLLEYVGNFSLSASKTVEWLRLLQTKEWIGGEKAPFKLLKDVNSGMPKPSHFSEYISNKLSKLPIRVVSFLECAACIGKQFDATLVAKALNESLPALLLELEELERINLVRDIEEEDNDYAFTSSIYVEIIRDRLNNRDNPNKVRVLAFEYHARLTKVLTERYQLKQNKSLLFQIANHALARSDHFMEDSVSWNLKAIEEYLHRHLAREAIQLCEKIEPYLRPLQNRDLNLQYYALKLEAYNDGRVSTEKMADVRAETKFLTGSIVRWLKKDDLEEGVRVYSLRLLVNYALNCRLAAFSDPSFLKECFECCDTVINYASAEQVWKVQALHYKGLAHQQDNNLKSCQEDLNAAIRLAESSAINKSICAQLYNSRAQYAYNRQEWNTQTIDDYNKSLELKKSSGDLLGQAMTLGGLAGFHMGLGDIHIKEHLTQLWDWTCEAFSINTALCSSFGQMLAINQAFTLLNMVSDHTTVDQWQAKISSWLDEWKDNLVDGSGKPRSGSHGFLTTCQIYKQVLQNDFVVGGQGDSIYVLDEITLKDHILKNHYHGKSPGSRFLPDATEEEVSAKVKNLFKKIVTDKDCIEDGNIQKWLASDTGENVGVDNLLTLANFPESQIKDYQETDGFSYKIIKTKGVETTRVTLVCEKLNVNYDGKSLCRVLSMYPSVQPVDIKSRDDINEMGFGFAVDANFLETKK